MLLYDSLTTIPTLVSHFWNVVGLDHKETGGSQDGSIELVHAWPNPCKAMSDKSR
jgi:hypothetical protein